jgi:Tfp pilus assembly protein PilW
MRATRRDLGQGEEGFTLVELVMATLGLMLISALMVTWFVGVNSAERAQSDADTAVRQALEVRERITRDLRRARGVTMATVAEVRVWLDDDGDEVQDTGEIVAWRIGTDGSLFRGVSGVERLEASGVDALRSGFTYDSGDAALVSRIDVALFIVAGDSVRSVDSTIYLRNSGDT